MSNPDADEIELTLDGAAHGGEAVGRTGDLVAFVALGLPGERVRAGIAERKARFLRGHVTRVITPSPDRVTPPCPIFGTCGGCHWQHAAYAAQLRFKTAVLRDQLERLGRFGDPPLDDAIASPLEWEYRNRVRLLPASVPATGRGAPVPAGRPGGGTERLLCFQRLRSHEPVPVERCYISDTLINRVIHEVPWAALPDATWSRLVEVDVRVVPGRDALVSLVAGSRIPYRVLDRFALEAMNAVPELRGVVAAVAPPRRGGGPARLTGQVIGESRLRYALAGRTFVTPADAFFQVNLGAAERLVETTIDWLSPDGDEVLVDAYAGAGTFAVALAPRVRRVVAIESHAAAAEYAAVNARDDANVEVVGGRVEDTLAAMDGGVDLLVLDPPRRGCEPGVLGEITRLAPRRIVYVSCEPSTLARDLRQLCDAGYALKRTRVVDMFPQTYHLESATLLERV